MEHKTWHTMTAEKETWAPGPWHDEPDKEQFTDPGTGLPCLVKRNHFGSLCGYVGVSEGHPWFAKGYDEVPADVHGGLTFADFCQEGDEAHTICHVPGPGEPDRVWWLGFDCGHAWDLAPGMTRYHSAGVDLGETYKPVGFVKAELARLAAQAAEAATAPVPAGG